MELLTIEQLAAETGMTVRNIRSHRARGLLGAPVVRERVGYYTHEDAARLKLVRELQSEGFNLHAIGSLLADGGEDPRGLLALRRALAATFAAPEPPQIMTVADLAERFAGDLAALTRAEELGVLVPLGNGRWEAPAPSLIEAASELAARGVPVAHALAVLRKVQDRCTDVAREFVRLVVEDLFRPRGALPEVVEAVERLGPLSAQVLLSVYGMTMSREVERALGKELKRAAARRARA